MLFSYVIRLLTLYFTILLAYLQICYYYFQ